MTKMNKVIQSDLLPKETFLVSTKATPRGLIEGHILNAAVVQAAGSVTGIYFSPIDRTNLGEEAKNKGETERAEAGLDLGNHNQVIVGITDKRLLIWSTKFFGGAKELLAAINRSQIKSIERIETKLLVANMPAIKITLKNNSSFDLQVAKVHIKKGEQIIEEFEN